MASIRQETRLDLGRRDLLTLCAPGRRTLACTRGEVWITFDGSREDVVLRAGERLDLDGRHGVVLSAVRPARLVLETPQPQGIACRLGPAAAAWAWTRRLRWHFPSLAGFPATRLR